MKGKRKAENDAVSPWEESCLPSGTVFPLTEEGRLLGETANVHLHARLCSEPEKIQWDLKATYLK